MRNFRTITFRLICAVFVLLGIAVIAAPGEDSLCLAAGFTANVVQTLVFDPAVNGGTFKLTYAGKTTAPIAWSANTQVLQGNTQAALNTLPTILLGNTAVSNSAGV